LPSHDRNSFGDNRATYHDVCIAYTQRKSQAEDRLAVLDLITDVWSIDASTVRELAANRQPEGWQSSGEWDRAWRVFYDLGHFRKERLRNETKR
jgi:hypothetical protein